MPESHQTHNTRKLQKLKTPNSPQIAMTATMTESTKDHLLFLRDNNPDIVRLDINHSVLQNWEYWRIQDFIASLPVNHVVETIHLSGHGLEQTLSESQIHQLLLNIGQMKGVKQLFVFQGDSICLDTTRLSNALSGEQLRTLVLFGFDDYSEHFSVALRRHPFLEKVSVHLPKRKRWGCLDVLAMGLAETPCLTNLQIRVTTGRQQEPLLSPEAFGVLLSSKSINTLYLENCGLLDDHMDVLLEELPKSDRLNSLDLKQNWLTDDAIFTTARLLPLVENLESLDLSGCELSDAAGEALAVGLAKNKTLLYLELEGTEERYRDEFNVPESKFAQSEWMHLVDFHLRIHRAYKAANYNMSGDGFASALNSVSDHISGIYYFMRKYKRTPN